MYTDYWNLTKPPFDNVPDSSMYVDCHESMENVISETIFAIKEGNECFAVIFGDVGLGKTLSLRIIIDSLEPEKYKVALITNPALSFVQLLREIIGQITGKQCEEKKKVDLLEIFNHLLFETHDQGQKIVIVIDESNVLSYSNLDDLRLLTNMQDDERNLFTLILAGQIELAEKLEHPKMANLFQRIGTYGHIEKIPSPEALQTYIDTRLQLAGASRKIFTDDSIPIIWEFSEHGTPRLTNKICKLCLKAGETNEFDMITGEVAEAIADRFKKISKPPAAKKFQSRAEIQETEEGISEQEAEVPQKKPRASKKAAAKVEVAPQPEAKPVQTKAVMPEPPPVAPAPPQPEVRPVEPKVVIPEPPPVTPAPPQPEVRPVEPKVVIPEPPPVAPAPPQPEVRPVEQQMITPEPPPVAPAPSQPEVRPVEQQMITPEPPPVQPEAIPVQPQAVMPERPHVAPVPPVPPKPETIPQESKVDVPERLEMEPYEVQWEEKVSVEAKAVPLPKTTSGVVPVAGAPVVKPAAMNIPPILEKVPKPVETKQKESIEKPAQAAKENFEEVSIGQQKLQLAIPAHVIRQAQSASAESKNKQAGYWAAQVIKANPHLMKSSLSDPVAMWFEVKNVILKKFQGTS